MRSLEIVVLGFGRMGRAALASLHQVSDCLQDSGIRPRLLAVLEADEALIRELPRHTIAKPIFVDTAAANPVAISGLLRSELGIQNGHEFLVYDATPTTCHRSNLVDICQSFPRALYIGEKPLFTTRAGLLTLGRFGGSVLCDFIESQNAAILKLLDMQREGFQIRRLRFWRLNSTGLRKLYEPLKRPGVTGGALLDKGIHDLALASILLRNGGPTPATSRVEEAINLSLMPHLVPAAEGAPGTKFTIPVPVPGSGNGAADAAGYARICWRSSCEVDAEFRYGWIGVDRFDELCAGLGQPSLRALLTGYGLEESAWLARAPLDEKPFDSFEQQEARVLVVDGTCKGRNEQLVVNFLNRPGIQPFLFHAGREEFLDLGQHPCCETSLARVFALAIRNYVGGKALVRSPLGATVIHEAHRLAFDISDEAFSTDPLSPAEEWVPSLCLAGQ